MSRLFGTDGIRGLANGEVLTAPFALDLAVAAAQVLAAPGGPRQRVVVGRDPRASGEFLEAAVTAGLASTGVDVLRAGVVPTPALARLTAVQDAAFGVMLSASHNPAPDNGIKLFARGGHKLDDALEDAVAAALGQPAPRPSGPGVGRVSDVDGDTAYLDHLLAALPHPLDGLTVVVDCAHGAASRVAPEALRRAGAQVVVIGAEPDGLNINEGCGSTHLDPLRAAVVEHGADVGIAHDGDADRCLAVDHTGEVVDGDQVLAVLALAARAAGRLARDTLVVTVMSNLGLHLAMREAGIEVVQTPVGDRYVLEAMRAGGYTLGGEQSGHVVALDHATTGDGPLTALLLLAEVARSGRPLRDLAAVVTRLPQVLVNVRGVDRSGTGDDAVVAAVRAAEAELGERGRVLLRPSGTEPVVRVMVEAPTQAQAQAVAASLADVVRERLAV